LSSAPIDHKRIPGKMRAQTSDLYPQRGSKLGNDGPDFLVIFCNKKSSTQGTDVIVDTTHNAPGWTGLKQQRWDSVKGHSRPLL